MFVYVILILIVGEEQVSYTITYEKNFNVVALKMFGVDKKEDHYSALDEIFELSNNHSCNKLLVDLRNLDWKTRNAFRCFKFGEFVSQKLKNIKIAHLLPPDASNRKDVSFISAVENNRGVTCQDFDNFNEALNWLTK